MPALVIYSFIYFFGVYCQCRFSLDLSRARWFGGFLFPTKGPGLTTLSLVFGCKFHRKEIVKPRTPGLPMIRQNQVQPHDSWTKTVVKLITSLRFSAAKISLACGIV